MKEIQINLDRLLCVLTTICVLFLALYVLVINNRLGELEAKDIHLNKRINLLQREAIYLDKQITANKLLLKETQKLVVPDELALKRRTK